MARYCLTKGLYFPEVGVLALEVNGKSFVPGW